MALKFARRAAVAVASAAVATVALVGTSGSASAATMSTDAPARVPAESVGHVTHDKGRDSDYRYDRDALDNYRHFYGHYDRYGRWVWDRYDRDDRQVRWDHWNDNRSSHRSHQDAGYDQNRQYRDGDGRSQNWNGDRG
ncbi:hypothetical protein ABZV65_28000 [Streptomyces bauhiniae]|uniref:hypothetical protein n=1 Tax=Streptomyces bauhiniae TaxID=2340725 RepID=UPI0033ABAAA9